jgi:hypothetical protein
MSRTEKLYERLRELETEYLQLLKAELQRVIDGGESWFLMIGQGYRRTRVYRTTDDQQIEALDTEIQRLREKLKEPTPDLYQNVDAFVEGASVSVRMATPERLWYTPDERTAIARKLREEIDDYLEALT